MKIKGSDVEDAEEFNSIIRENNTLPTKLTDNAARLIGALTPKGDEDEESEETGFPTQWALYKTGYRPATPTVSALPPGCYDICADQSGAYAVPSLPPSGLLLELPEMRSDYVISLVERFWDSEADYKEGNEFVRGGAAYRAGVMLYGVAGGGKSSTIKILSKKIIERGGTVFFADTHPAVVMSFLSDFARGEKNRKSVVILEDLDSLFENFGESGYLQLLDSAKTIDNVLFIATTNYPERLDPRIYNRPGRFSHVVKVGLPGEEARRAYLKALLKDHRDVETMVSLTHGFTIDHLNALVSAVYREKKVLVDEIARLRSLFRVPKAGEQTPIGF